MTDDRLGGFVLPIDTAVGDVLLWFDAGAYHLPGRHGFRRVYVRSPGSVQTSSSESPAIVSRPPNRRLHL